LKIEIFIENCRKKIDKALDSYLPKEKEYPSVIHKAMRYSVFSGGKRIRPALLLAACQAAGGDVKKAMPAACGIELIHTFSLIHDDLPSMDDDDYRRGKLTCHKKYGEAIALLAGDALLNLSFQLFAKSDPKIAVRIIETASKAVGTRGMIGGQVVDINSKEKDPGLPTLQYINTHKTGALIAASLKIGGIIGGASENKIQRLQKYGEYLGVAFQIIDDVMDSQGYAEIFGDKGAMREAARLTQKAKKEIKVFGKKAEVLEGISDHLLRRTI